MLGTAMFSRNPAAVVMSTGWHFGPCALPPSLVQLQGTPGICPVSVTPSGLSTVYDSPSAAVSGAWQPRGRKIVPTNFQPEGTSTVKAVSSLPGSFTSALWDPLQEFMTT